MALLLEIYSRGPHGLAVLGVDHDVAVLLRDERVAGGVGDGRLLGALVGVAVFFFFFFFFLQSSFLSSVFPFSSSYLAQTSFLST